MQRFFPLLLLFLPLMFLASARAWGAEIPPERVVVVANRGDADSLALARHYMQARNIPAANLIELTFNDDEEIFWSEFVERCWNPLLETLHSRNWIKGELMPEADFAGRQRISCVENRVGYLVLCRGVPLRIKNDAKLAEKEKALARLPIMNTTTASVDSELATLTMAGTPAIGAVDNPLFGGKRFLSGLRETLLIVARLDGPTFADCHRMVDNALLAEKNGVAGRAYVDSGGPYADGDRWFHSVAEQLVKAGFDTTHEESRALLDFDTRGDAPVFYFGWYATHASGRFGDPALRFLPGAVAFHLHSFSASTLRSTTRQWTGPLVARGATITFGNVAEPFLGYSMRPDLFAATLLRGEQAGEAYASAVPAWSWQSVFIGDPLYRPFKVPLEKQLELLKTKEAETDAALGGAWRDGVLLRHANLLAAEGKRAEAMNVLAAAVREHPTPALRLALAHRAIHPALAWNSSDGDKTTDAGLLAEIARYLWKDFKLSDAHLAYKAALEANPDLPAHIRKKLLCEAADVAEDSGQSELAAMLRKQI
jgi:uncharacterized protein (TIGR03790 family)